MFNTIIRALLANVAVAALVGAFVLFSGVRFVEDGRLTDAACYLLGAGLVAFTAAAFVFDFLAVRGRVSVDRLPAFLRDEYDAARRERNLT